MQTYRGMCPSPVRSQILRLRCDHAAKGVFSRYSQFCSLMCLFLVIYSPIAWGQQRGNAQFTQRAARPQGWAAPRVRPDFRHRTRAKHGSYKHHQQRPQFHANHANGFHNGPANWNSPGLSHAKMNSFGGPSYPANHFQSTSHLNPMGTTGRPASTLPLTATWQHPQSFNKPSNTLGSSHLLTQQSLQKSMSAVVMNNSAVNSPWKTIPKVSGGQPINRFQHVPSNIHQKAATPTTPGQSHLLTQQASQKPTVVAMRKKSALSAQHPYNSTTLAGSQIAGAQRVQAGNNATSAFSNSVSSTSAIAQTGVPINQAKRPTGAPYLTSSIKNFKGGNNIVSQGSSTLSTAGENLSKGYSASTTAIASSSPVRATVNAANTVTTGIKSSTQRLGNAISQPGTLTSRVGLPGVVNASQSSMGLIDLGGGFISQYGGGNNIISQGSSAVSSGAENLSQGYAKVTSSIANSTPVQNVGKATTTVSNGITNSAHKFGFAVAAPGKLVPSVGVPSMIIGRNPLSGLPTLSYPAHLPGPDDPFNNVNWGEAGQLYKGSIGAVYSAATSGTPLPPVLRYGEDAMAVSGGGLWGMFYAAADLSGDHKLKTTAIETYQGAIRGGATGAAIGAAEGGQPAQSLAE